MLTHSKYFGQLCHYPIICSVASEASEAATFFFDRFVCTVCTGRGIGLVRWKMCPKWSEILSDMAENQNLSVWYQYAQLMYAILKSRHLVRSLFSKKLRFFSKFRVLS